jgi:hypothetical protein
LVISPLWPPTAWEGDAFPADDSDAAIREWFDLGVATLPHLEALLPDKGRPGVDAGGPWARNAYRLLRHLRDRGRTAAEDDEPVPCRPWPAHDAWVVLRRLRDKLFAVGASGDGSEPPPEPQPPLPPAPSPGCSTRSSRGKTPPTTLAATWTRSWPSSGGSTTTSRTG